MLDSRAAGEDSNAEVSGRGPRLWLLQGKTAGDNAQVLALGESLTTGTGWQAEIKTLSPDLRQAAKRRRPQCPAPDLFAASGMTPPWPEAVIACGRTPCIVAQWLKESPADAWCMCSSAGSA